MSNLLYRSMLPILSVLISAHLCLADNAHYDALQSSPSLHASFPMRSQAEINALTHGQGQLPGQPGGNNPSVQYDAAMDAARVTINANSASLALAWQLRPFYPLLDKTNATEVSIQWEARWDSSYLDSALHNHKAFQIAETTGDDRHFEMQTRFSQTDTSAVALPTVRTYGNSNGGDGNSDPLRSDEGTHFNFQPGGDTHAPRNGGYTASNHLKGDPQHNAFVIRANKWIRYTASITFTGGQQRIRLWMADEDSGSVLVVADPNNPALGFLSDAAADSSGSDHFWVEFNTSQDERTGPPLLAWVRNLVVFKNATVPLGTFGPPDTTAPSAPSGLNGVAVNSNRIDLSWSAATDGESGVQKYMIYRNGVQIAESTSTSYSDTTVQPGTLYSYEVSAVNGAGLEGAKSSAENVSTPADTIAPKIISTSPVGSTTVLITFSEQVELASAQNASNYGLDNGASVFSATVSGDGLSVTLSTSSLSQGTTYTLTVNNVRDRAVLPNTIAVNSQVQFSIGTRVTANLVALYELEESSGSTVRDTSGVGTALDLSIANTANTSWIAGGLSIDAATIVSSAGAATKISNAVSASGEITLEAWVQSNAVAQSGPARIVTLSSDHYNRNFTLGQDSSKYQIRLRSTTSGNNGSSPSVSSGNLVQTANLSHVVYTRDASGAARVYIDGALDTSATIGGGLSNWDDTYRFALANELTNDRAWLGDIHLVAVYDKALSATEVQENFKAGANPSSTPGDSTAPAAPSNLRRMQ